MSNQKIFCNVPWTNTHIYWDGSFGMCCSERMPPHQEPTKYNLKNMTVAQWHATDIMEKARAQIKGNQALPQCVDCYHEEAVGYESRRIKENFKSVIFTEQAFERSYQQSPMYDIFENPIGIRQPVDWHVDLGNECNLTCRMCRPSASSKISSLYTKWQLIDVSANRNWTLDPQSWQNFTNSVLATTNLNRIHFMGGEPMLNKRFPELLDFLIDNNKTNLSISFVTNGTLFDQTIIDRLKQFRSCDIEVSIESIEPNNNYLRTGTDTTIVISNILKLVKQQSDTFHVVLRSAPQLLSINNYYKLIAWAWEQQLPLQGVPVNSPGYLQISVLPSSLRQQFIKHYESVRDSIDLNQFTGLATGLATGRNVGTLNMTLRRECDAMINLLRVPEPSNIKELQTKLATWLQRWDNEYELNAYDYYPEYREFLDAIQYRV